MMLHGLQKLTLLDYPGRMACTVFLAGCNYRCPFCHNSELLNAAETPPALTDGELLAFLEKRKGMLDGVCITGGEPILNPELPELLEKIKALGYPVKLDTNGTRPALLARLIGDGLVDYVAMDVKNAPERYAETAGVPEPLTERVRESVALLLHGTVEYEFRTTVVAELHDADSIRGIGALIRGAKRYYLQPFADRDTVAYAGLHAPEAAELRNYAEIAAPFVERVEIRGI